MQIVALIPAAGKGRRFGMPKVDAGYNGITFSQMILNTLQEAGVEQSLVIRDVETFDMLASIKHGMKTFLSKNVHPDGWLIWPVDHPMIKPHTIKELINTFNEKTKCIVIPRYNNTNGHPIIIPYSLTMPDIAPENGLKEVIMLSHLAVHHVYVNDPGILININTPEDINYV